MDQSTLFTEYRPRLRPGLTASPNGTIHSLLLFDSNRITPSVVSFPRPFLEVLKLCNGFRTLREIHREVTAQTIGITITVDEISKLVAVLDEALLLDSPTFLDYLTGPIRKPSCIGCYPAEPDAIRTMLSKLFTGPGGPGEPGAPGSAIPEGKRLRAALLPHIDYTRGGVTYGWGFKELIEQTDARLFVIIATSHYSPQRFTLTRMNFSTPLGIVETDQNYVDRLANHFGNGLFDDPIAHLPEHSIELEVLMLQYLFEKHGPIRIVPLLVGSFFDCIRTGADPTSATDIQRMVEALRFAEAAANEPVCYLISGDLAHIGPKFGDPQPVNEPWLTESRKQDHRILDELAQANTAGFFNVIAAEKDERRICGLPPAWITLATAKPREGKILHYNRAVHEAGHESVSFAAAAFYE